MATARLPPDFSEFLRLLNSFGVEYLVVGGYAVGYYGYPRATADIDLWVRVAPNNAQRLVDALRAFGFDTPSLSTDLWTTCLATDDPRPETRDPRPETQSVVRLSFRRVKTNDPPSLAHIARELRRGLAVAAVEQAAAQAGQRPTTPTNN